jgi:hypothetical protein
MTNVTLVVSVKGRQTALVKRPRIATTITRVPTTLASAMGV